MRYRWIHECEKPNMELDKRPRQYTTGWGWFKSVHTTSDRIFETKTVRWNCPVCQSQWEYHNSNEYLHGTWYCLQRPEVWKDYE